LAGLPLKRAELNRWIDEQEAKHNQDDGKAQYESTEQAKEQFSKGIYFMKSVKLHVNHKIYITSHYDLLINRGYKSLCANLF